MRIKTITGIIVAWYDMAVLHLRCLNLKATPEMCKLLANACLQAATMQAEMVTNVAFEGGQLNETREMVSPLLKT